MEGHALKALLEQWSVKDVAVCSDGSMSNGSDRRVKSGDAYEASVVPSRDFEREIPLGRDYSITQPAHVAGSRCRVRPALLNSQGE